MSCWLRGADCRVLTTRILDPELETSLDEVMGTLEPPAQKFQAELRAGGAVEVIELSVNCVRVTLMPTASSRAERSPDPREAAIFLELAERVFDRFRPDVLLTHGGHPASLELMGRARQRGIAVVFHLHNFGHSEPKVSDSKKDRRAFVDVSAVILPSEYSRRHHARLLGLDGPVIPDLIPLVRIFATDPEPKYVTLTNPQPSKCVTVFARIATAFYRGRPDFPLLIGLMPQFNAASDLENWSRVEVWRGGLGRCLCSLLARPFVCGCHIIATVLRFHTPLIKPGGPISGTRLSDKAC